MKADTGELTVEYCQKVIKAETVAVPTEATPAIIKAINEVNRNIIAHQVKCAAFLQTQIKQQAQPKK